MGRAQRTAKKQRCFSPSGSMDRIESNLPLWQSCLLLPGSVDVSWLARNSDGNFQCKACRYADAKVEISDFKRNNPRSLSTEAGIEPRVWTRLQTFKQHQRCRQHKVNALVFVRETMPEIPLADVASPADDFRHLLQQIKDRTVKKETKYAKRMKIRRMVYCLAEAARRKKQALFAMTPQACIMHDGADSKLFARWTCSTVNGLDRASGYLGTFAIVAEHKTADSLALAQSLAAITKIACTEWHGAPGKNQEWMSKNMKLNTAAYENFRKSVSQLIADEAKDEGRAQELLSDKQNVNLKAKFPQLQLEEVLDMFPNANLHLADKAHSGKRMVYRGWNGIPEMKEINLRFIVSEVTSKNRPQQ